ncbi:MULTISPECIES: FAD-binding domain-containing protein [unclassified Tardiphaga]|uniref:FAD-binding domain-containing protein n=1 Tax=unclassified Tardiphaga TaxID=2631404 RepID=UPI001FEE2B3A|nr:MULTISPECIES: FAD-binding domain-containing protein [unclassified Tardiphaga]
MKAFTPAMGQQYANGRSYDIGPRNREAVSVLSPWIRRRLVTESEVIAAALAAHGLTTAGKFIEEVIWRSYFKGWMERRPQVWDSYRNGLLDDLAKLGRDSRLRLNLSCAEAGETGLDCFDSWSRELVETGYLHNHARMWFASIWIFTLGLPWRLGADFFYRHLIDGDPASNTLGWRWVAGLHTRGKPYRAQAWNIATFTGQRFTPSDSNLAEVVAGLEAYEPDGLPPLLPLRAVTTPQRCRPTGLLITEEDCGIEDFAHDSLDIRAAATLAASHLRSPLPVADAVAQFENVALADTVSRTKIPGAALRADHSEVLARWAEGADVTQIVTPYVPRGPLYDWLTEAVPVLAARGIVLAEWRRDWDSAIWPDATAGFFKVKQQIPRILHEMGLA